MKKITLKKNVWLQCPIVFMDIFSREKTIFKIHVRRATGRGCSYFHLYMCVFFIYVFIQVCHACWLNEKRYRPEFGTHRFLSFRKSYTEGRQRRKTAASREFSAYPPYCLVYFIFNRKIIYGTPWKLSKFLEIWISAPHGDGMVDWAGYLWDKTQHFEITLIRLNPALNFGQRK